MKHYLLIAVLLLTSYFSYAQERTVSGKVTDESNNSMPGVNIMVMGSSAGTTTDIDGNFKLSVDPEATLRFSFIGYSTVEVPVNGRSVIDVQMSPDLQSLNEVVVVGYGSTSKRN